MKYIPERYMVSAVPVNGGERVTGHYLPIDYTGTGKIQHNIIAPNGNISFAWHEVNPDTIEPVRAKVIVETEDDREYIDYICPNCKSIIDQRRKGQRIGFYTPHFHADCGMALEWED